LTAAISGLSRSKRCDSPAKPVAGRRTRPAPPGGLYFEVVAGGESALAGAGDDADPQLGIGGELVPHPVEFPMRLAVQRIHDLRPIDRDDAQPPLIGDGAEAVFGHRWPRARIRG
jgi:hypothetical protein